MRAQMQWCIALPGAAYLGIWRGMGTPGMWDALAAASSLQVKAKAAPVLLPVLQSRSVHGLQLTCPPPSPQATFLAVCVVRLDWCVDMGCRTLLLSSQRRCGREADPAFRARVLQAR
jgi:hypothetical protein